MQRIVIAARHSSSCAGNPGVERADEVFESRDLAIDWLNSKNAALSGLTPLSLMDTDVGTESVLDTLGRIEHGVFA